MEDPREEGGRGSGRRLALCALLGPLAFAALAAVQRLASGGDRPGPVLAWLEVVVEHPWRSSLALGLAWVAVLLRPAPPALPPSLGPGVGSRPTAPAEGPGARPQGPAEEPPTAPAGPGPRDARPAGHPAESTPMGPSRAGHGPPRLGSRAHSG